MEHFGFFPVCVFSTPSNFSVFVFYPSPQSASQSLLCLMYVIPIRRNTWVYDVSSLLSYSLSSSFLPFLHTDRQTDSHYAHLHPLNPIGEIQILESVGFLKLP